MVAPFDIFYLQGDSQVIWQCMADTLEIARLRVRTLIAVKPGDYLICSKQTGHKMMIKADGSMGPFLSTSSSLP